MPWEEDENSSGGGLTSPVGVSDGGTGANTAAGARTNLGVPALSHQHAAGDLNSGQVALARGGTGADLSATGGTGQVLRQNTAGGAITVSAISGADISSGTVAAARLGSGSPTSSVFLRGDGVWSGVSLGNLNTGAIPSTVPLRFSQANTTNTNSAEPEIFVNTNQLIVALPSGWSHTWRISGANYFAVSTLACLIGTDQTGNTGGIGFWRNAQGFIINATAARSVRLQCGGPQSIPTGAAWTTIGSVTGLSLGTLFAHVAGHGFIEMTWDGTTLVKERGASTLVVAGSAGATEVAFRVSSGSLQASNGTGTARNASCSVQMGH